MEFLRIIGPRSLCVEHHFLIRVVISHPCRFGLPSSRTPSQPEPDVIISEHKCCPLHYQVTWGVSGSGSPSHGKERGSDPFRVLPPRDFVRGVYLLVSSLGPRVTGISLSVFPVRTKEIFSSVSTCLSCSNERGFDGPPVSHHNVFQVLRLELEDLLQVLTELYFLWKRCFFSLEGLSSGVRELMTTSLKI